MSSRWLAGALASAASASSSAALAAFFSA
eukprot:COSAG01_NODE_37085_length_508_cov_2.136919_1_plen_28_part_01